MKKIFITFLIFIINFSLFHLSFAQTQNDFFSGQCSEHTDMLFTEKSSDCAKDCLSNINKISSPSTQQNEQKSTKKSLDTPVFPILLQTTSYFENKSLLFYQKNFLYIPFKLYHHLIGIIKNIR